jgi:hypothetical protein
MDCCKDNIEIKLKIENTETLKTIFGWTNEQVKLYKMNLGKEVTVFTGNKEEVSRLNMKLAEQGIPFKNQTKSLK